MVTFFRGAFLYTFFGETHASTPGTIILQVTIYQAFTAGQQLRVKWTTLGGTIALVSIPSVGTTIPAAPSIILNINQIALAP